MPQFKGNLVGAPIPGQSLTREPKSRTYETPPQFTEEDEALEYIIPRIMNPEAAAQTAALMSEKRVPATVIADSILMSGFAQGQWTPDLAILIAVPVYAAIVKSVELVGGKPILGNEKEFKEDTNDRFKGLKDIQMEKPASPAEDSGSFLAGDVDGLEA